MEIVNTPAYVENHPASEPEMRPAVARLNAPRKVSRKTLPRKCPLLSIKNIAWESAKQPGAWECWECPDRAKERSKKTYLGYVGKRLLAEWLALDARERRAVILKWIEEKKAGK